MNVQVQMIGTGSAFAKKYFNNNALVYCNDYTLLIDCGITAPMALYQMGIKFDQIDGIFITHLHGDHVGGLEELAFQMKYIYKRKPTLFLPSALVEPLWENTLKGGLEHTVEGTENLHSYFEVVPIEENQPADIQNGFSLEILQTRHLPNKLSYSLIINGLLFYSADVIFSKDLIDYVHKQRNCKYMLHDCELSHFGLVHTTLSELLTLPEEIQEKIYLMHYGDNMSDFIDQTGKMKFLEQHKRYDFV